MRNREYFLREDLNTFKRKFKLLCNKCEFRVEKVAKEVEIDYICKEIKIEKL